MLCDRSEALMSFTHVHRALFQACSVVASGDRNATAVPAVAASRVCASSSHRSSSRLSLGDQLVSP
ncbi:unnamed protein product [Diplocarpon coronariae]